MAAGGGRRCAHGHHCTLSSCAGKLLTWLCAQAVCESFEASLFGGTLAAASPNVDVDYMDTCDAQPKGIASAPASPPVRGQPTSTLARNASDPDTHPGGFFTSTFEGGGGFTPFLAPMAAANWRDLACANSSVSSESDVPAASSEQHAYTQPPAYVQLSSGPLETAVPGAVSASKADFVEAGWMLKSHRFTGVGVRPDNIPPTEIETFRGAFFKELAPRRRKKKRRSRYAPEPDVWVFKGGPKGSSRRNCKFVVVSVSFAHFSRSVLLLAIHVGANGTGLVERCYGSVTLRAPTPEDSPRIRLSAHRYRIVTETTPSVKMEGSAELWHVLPLAMGGVRAGP